MCHLLCNLGVLANCQTGFRSAGDLRLPSSLGPRLIHFQLVVMKQMSAAIRDIPQIFS